ncbi:MAG: Gfo/Idh/MocA family oxidoreductase [Candidatus Polarisedimenticolia bacterium]|nr:Gfo/Idh/MocA family oxidoreductase [bacterium]
MTENVLRVGLAGLGRHGMRYAQHLLAGDAPRARLVAVFRRDADEGRAWAAPRNLALHSSLEALVADPNVDVLVVALPPTEHPRAIKLAAAAGKPILVEKPLAVDSRQAAEAVEVAAKAGIKAMVAQTMRFNSVVRAVRERIPAMGPLHLVAVNNRFEPATRPWFNAPEQGGMIINTGVHSVDLLRFLTGAEIVEVKAFGRRVLTPEIDDAFAAVLRLEPGGILVTLDNSWATGGRTGRLEIVGEKGQLAADHVHSILREIHGRQMIKPPLPDSVPTVREVLRAFTTALQEGGPVPVPLEEGLKAVQGAEMIARAVAERK